MHDKQCRSQDMYCAAASVAAAADSYAAAAAAGDVSDCG